MKHLWVVWALVLMVLIASPGLVPSEASMTQGQRLYKWFCLGWMYGVPAALVAIHLYRRLRRPPPR